MRNCACNKFARQKQTPRRCEHECTDKEGRTNRRYGGGGGGGIVVHSASPVTQTLVSVRFDRATSLINWTSKEQEICALLKFKLAFDTNWDYEMVVCLVVGCAVVLLTRLIRSAIDCRVLFTLQLRNFLDTQKNHFSTIKALKSSIYY